MRASRIPLSEIALLNEGSVLKRTDQLTPIATQNMGMNGLLWKGFLNTQEIIRDVLGEEFSEVYLPTPIEVAGGPYSRESAPSEEEIAVKFILETGTKDLPKSFFYFKKKLLEDAPYGVSISTNVSHQLIVYSFSETAEDMYNQGEIMKMLFNKIFKRIGLSEEIFVSRTRFEEMSNESIMFLYPNGEEHLLHYPSKKLWVDKNSLFFISKKPGFPRDLNNFEEHTALQVGEFIFWGKLKTKYRRFHFESIQAPFYVGKYIIDLSRAMDVIIHQNTGDSGFVWPYEISPYKLHLICSKERIEKAEYIYDELRRKQISVLFDDRDIPFDEKYEFARLLGIPKIIIISEETGRTDARISEVDRTTCNQEFSYYQEILKTP